MKTPINLITELANTDKGTDRLVEMNIIPTLLAVLDEEDKFKRKKAVLWILGKICIYNINIIRL